MNYLIYVSFFGTAVTIFLWLRDARIFFRTGLPGYRTAAYYGVLYGALASLGSMVTMTMESFDLAGLGLILLAMYLQGTIEREKIWKNESTLERFLGSVPIKRAQNK
jgi:hypothetical protein